MSRREQSLESLYYEHAAGLLGFITYQTGDRALGEDIVADTFERLLMTGSSWRGRSAPKTWLYSIALNRVRDVVRRRGAENRALARVQVTLGLDDLGAVTDRDLLHRAMQALSEEERAVVALRFGGELSLSEIAELLEERRSTIEVRLYRGLRRLRDAAASNRPKKALRGRPNDGRPARLRVLMDRHRSQPPEDLRDIAERLVDARGSFSALELDELHGRIGRRIQLVPRPSGIGARRRRNSIAGLAAAGLMLSSGVGAVIALTSLGGSQGHGASLSKNLTNTFGETSLHHMKDASDCAFEGPFSATYSLGRGTADVTFVQECGNVTVDVRSDASLDWRFGDGLSHHAKGSWAGTVPAGTATMTVSIHGATYMLPVSW